MIPASHGDFYPTNTFTSQWRYMSVMASQITGNHSVYSTVYWGLQQSKCQKSSEVWADSSRKGQLLQKVRHVFFRHWIPKMVASNVGEVTVCWGNLIQMHAPFVSNNIIYRKVSNIIRTLVGNKIVELRCSRSSACRRCSNYIFILYLTPGFNGFVKDNCKMRRETFMFWD